MVNINNKETRLVWRTGEAKVCVWRTGTASRTTRNNLVWRTGEMKDCVWRTGAAILTRRRFRNMEQKEDGKKRKGLRTEKG